MDGYPLLSLAGAPDDGRSEIQRLTKAGTVSGGTFTITYDGEETAAIAGVTGTAAIVQAALEALPNIGVGDVIVTGGPLAAAALTLTFAGQLAGLDLAEVTADGGNLTGAGAGVTPSTPTEGIQGSFRGAQHGAKLQDTVGGDLYENTGTATVPVWESPPAARSAIADRLTEQERFDSPYVDTAHMPEGANEYSFGPIRT